MNMYIVIAYCDSQSDIQLMVILHKFTYTDFSLFAQNRSKTSPLDPLKI